MSSSPLSLPVRSVDGPIRSARDVRPLFRELPIGGPLPRFVPGEWRVPDPGRILKEQSPRPEEGEIRVHPALPLRLIFLGLAGVLALGTTPASAQQGALRGIVTDSTGAPVPDADVGIVALKRLTRTDEHGRFMFGKLPLGKVELSVRRLAYEPRRVNFLVASETDSLRITLVAQAALLNSVNVSKGEIRQRENIEDFYRRMTRGVGQYVSREQIEKRWGGTPSDMIRTIPGVRLVRAATGGYGVRFPNTSLGRNDCAPMIWIDGQRAPGMEIDGITLGDLEGIELYKGPSTTPTQFSQGQGANNCGTIVMWSRPSQYQTTARYKNAQRERNKSKP